MPNDPSDREFEQVAQSLEGYQDALVELLSNGTPIEEVIAKLKAEPRLKDYREYIESFDPDMVAVAGELMGKWARRKTT